MDADEPKRRWYRKRRWWAAAALWLLVGYPLGLGPVSYAECRGWLPGEFAVAYSWPYFWATTQFDRYRGWCGDLGFRHRREAEERSFIPDPAINRTVWTPPKPEASPEL